jgi:hypothetical protein
MTRVSVLDPNRLHEEICTRRIEELSAELASLEARRSELAEEISESQPSSRTLPRSRSSWGTSSGRYVAVPAGTEGCDASDGGRDHGPRWRSHPAGLPRPHS